VRNFIICTPHQVSLSSPIKEYMVDGACGMHARGEKSVQGFTGKHKGKRPLRRPRCVWDDGIRMALGEIGWGVLSGFNWLRIETGGMH
jgi:hypothetical protein